MRARVDCRRQNHTLIQNGTKHHNTNAKLPKLPLERLSGWLRDQARAARRKTFLALLAKTWNRHKELLPTHPSSAPVAASVAAHLWLQQRRAASNCRCCPAHWRQRLLHSVARDQRGPFLCEPPRAALATDCDLHPTQKTNHPATQQILILHLRLLRQLQLIADCLFPSERYRPPLLQDWMASPKPTHER